MKKLHSNLLALGAVVAGCALLAFSLCDVSAPAEAGAQEPEPAAPKAAPLALEVGQCCMTVLESQAGTGYCWQLAEELPVDAPVAVTLDQGVCKDENCCGFPVPVTLTLSGQKPGKVLLRFIYARPWEKGKAPLREQIYAVEVLP